MNLNSLAKVIACGLLAATFVSCYTPHPDPYVRQGRRTGAAVGAATGAIIGNNVKGGNSWGGAAIGAALGGMAGDRRGKSQFDVLRRRLPGPLLLLPLIFCPREEVPSGPFKMR